MFHRNLPVIGRGTPAFAKEKAVKVEYGKYLLMLLACLTVAFFIASCSSKSDPAGSLPFVPFPSQTKQLSGTLGPAGGTLTSSDGRLSLMVPAGALAADTEITITEMAADEIPSVFDGFVVEKAFRVEPVGLDFAADVEITLTLELAPPSATMGTA